MSTLGILILIVFYVNMFEEMHEEEIKGDRDDRFLQD